MATTYLMSKEVNDGYNGKKTTVYLCYDQESKNILTVHRHGYYRSSLNGFHPLQQAEMAKHFWLNSNMGE